MILIHSKKWEISWFRIGLTQSSLLYMKSFNLRLFIFYFSAIYATQYVQHIWDSEINVTKLSRALNSELVSPHIPAPIDSLVVFLHLKLRRILRTLWVQQGKVWQSSLLTTYMAGGTRKKQPRKYFYHWSKRYSS